MSASRNISTDERIAEQAALWLIDLEENEADLSAFASWLQASPRHVEEFLLVSAVWRAADRIDAARRIEVDQLIAQARDNVKRLDEESTSLHVFNIRQRMRSALHSRLTAVVALVAVAFAAYVGLHDNSLQYRTGIGEQRVVKLADGSIVTLNTRSKIKVRLEAQQRIVELTDGEALFEVAHDPNRPFRVIAGVTTVKAVGTQFDVNRAAHSTTVAVVQGVVELSSAMNASGGQVEGAQNRPERLVAGEQARVSAQGELLQHSAAQLDRVTAWRERKLIFRNEPLTSIVAEFNRYNEAQLRVDGDVTGARLISGVFEADNPGALIAFLQRDPKLSIESRGETIVIRGP
ncbi:MAG TPA: FecR domain-containing protein [Steroidobacteraceae bacterium]|nr:FecR domain-containing protein [Steroidobacteraceae bacterium]